MDNCNPHITCSECMAANDGKCPKVLHVKEPYERPVMTVIDIKQEEENA